MHTTRLTGLKSPSPTWSSPSEKVPTLDIGTNIQLAETSSRLCRSITVTRYFPPVAWRGRTGPIRMHTQRTAVVGQHDLDDIPGRSVQFTQVPTSDPRANASGFRSAFSVGLLNFNAIAVSAMIFFPWCAAAGRSIQAESTELEIALDQLTESDLVHRLEYFGHPRLHRRHRPVPDVVARLALKLASLAGARVRLSSILVEGLPPGPARRVGSGSSANFRLFWRPTWAGATRGKRDKRESENHGA
jgi:hypothetical protein